MLHLEPANPTDVTTFMEMEREPDTAKFIIADSYEQHLANLEDPATPYLRVAIANRTAGFILLRLDPDGSSVEFRRIVVDWKGVGVGRAAIERMHVLCRDELRRTRVWLDVFEYNVRARHLYEKLGYEQFAQHDVKAGRLICYQKWI